MHTISSTETKGRGGERQEEGGERGRSRSRSKREPSASLDQNTRERSAGLRGNSGADRRPHKCKDVLKKK